MLSDKKIPIHNRFNLELLKLVDNNKIEIDSLNLINLISMKEA